MNEAAATTGFSALQTQLKALKTRAEEMKTLLEQQQELLRRRGISLPANAIDRLWSVRSSIDKLSLGLVETQMQLQQLRRLADTTALVNSAQETDLVLNEVMETVIQLTQAERGYIVLKNRETGELEFKVARGLSAEETAAGGRIVSWSVINMVAESGEPLLTVDAGADEQFSHSESIAGFSLLSILGVTVMANFFMFAYFPAVQLIGDQVNATASQIGIIGSMTGFGMITGSLVTARWGDGRWGIACSFGVFVAMALLIVWALSPNVLIAVITLYVASCGSGLFAATQSTLVLTTVSEEMRGRAMGLLSMAIGALPVGTYVLGEVAQQLGARVAVILMASLGLAGMTLWLLIRPEVLQRSGPTP